MTIAQKARGFVFKNSVFILIGIFMFYVLLNKPNFFSAGNLIALASEGCCFGIISIGMTMLMITGSMDMSVGAQLYLAGIVTIKIYQQIPNIFVCLLVSTALTVMISMFNGVMIAKLGLPPMIATFAVKNVCKGCASLLIGEESVISMPASFTVLGRAKVFWIPISVISLFVLFAVFIVVMQRTRFGRYLYAAGNNADALEASGVKVFRVRELAFAITGVFCGYAGVINVSRLGGAQFNLGEGMEFSCIAAVVVGGTSMNGGSGSMVGSLFGVAIIAALDQLLRMFSVSDYLRNTVWGIIVLLTVCADILKHYEMDHERELLLVKKAEMENEA